MESIIRIHELISCRLKIDIFLTIFYISFNISWKRQTQSFTHCQYAWRAFVFFNTSIYWKLIIINFRNTIEALRETPWAVRTIHEKSDAIMAGPHKPMFDVQFKGKSYKHNPSHDMVIISKCAAFFHESNKSTNPIVHHW